MCTVYSGSPATLSPWRSGESCLSKDQRETPLMSSTEVNQTGVESENRKLGEIRLETGSGQEKESGK